MKNLKFTTVIGFFFILFIQLVLLIIFINTKDIVLIYIDVGFICLNFIIWLLYQYLQNFLDNHKKSNEVAREIYLSNSLIDFVKAGYIIYDKNYRITWISDYLNQSFDENYFGQKITKIIPNIETIQKDIKIAIYNGNKFYDGKILTNLNCVLIKDSTDSDFLAKQINNDQTVVWLMSFQELAKTLNMLSEKERFLVNEKLLNYLINWSIENNFFIRKLSSEEFMLLLTKKQFLKLKSEKKLKQLLDRLLKIIEKQKINVSISFGIAHGVVDFEKLYDAAIQNIQLANSRGSNQIIIKDFRSSENEIIDRDTNQYIEQNVTKIDIFYRELESVIKIASNVLIVGHIWPDYDSIGASLGMKFITDRNKISSRVLLNTKKIDEDIWDGLKNSFNKTEREVLFINEANAAKFLTEGSLVIVVDTNGIDRISKPELLDKISNIVFIDHHRSRAVDPLQHLNYIDVNVSSTSEIVTRLIQIYLNNSNEESLNIDNRLLNLLLSGIVVDTNYFRTKTTNLTFAASSFLEKNGADMHFVNNLLKQDLEDVVNINTLIHNAEIVSDQIAIVTCPKSEKFSRSTFAIVAQKLLDIKNVSASFVIGKDLENLTCISCRSSAPSYNVDLIANKLGGGGHFNEAASQSSKLSIDEMKSALLKSIEQYKQEQKKVIKHEGLRI